MSGGAAAAEAGSDGASSRCRQPAPDGGGGGGAETCARLDSMAAAQRAAARRRQSFYAWAYASVALRACLVLCHGNGSACAGLSNMCACCEACAEAPSCAHPGLTSATWAQRTQTRPPTTPRRDTHILAGVCVLSSAHRPAQPRCTPWHAAQCTCRACTAGPAQAHAGSTTQGGSLRLVPPPPPPPQQRRRPRRRRHPPGLWLQRLRLRPGAPVRHGRAHQPLWRGRRLPPGLRLLLSGSPGPGTPAGPADSRLPRSRPPDTTWAPRFPGEPFFVGSVASCRRVRRRGRAPPWRR